MGKLKKEIWINGKTYSTNKARKFLSDKLKQNNTMKCTFNGIFKKIVNSNPKSIIV